MINIFYLYAVVEILNVIYYLRSYLKDYKKNKHNGDIIDVMNPIDTLSNVDKFGFVMSILSFIWVIMGLFTMYKMYFVLLMIITYTRPFYLDKLSRKTQKNTFILSSFIKIFILLLLIYKNILFI